MNSQRINPDGLHKPIGCYSQVVRRGNFVAAPAWPAIDEAGNVVGPNDVAAQTVQTIKNLQVALRWGGCAARRRDQGDNIFVRFCPLFRHGCGLSPEFSARFPQPAPPFAPTSFIRRCSSKSKHGPYCRKSQHSVRKESGRKECHPERLAELAELDLAQPERVTLNDQVYDDLRRLIISGRMRPGQTISIRTMAAVINVSPMPVRNALQRLVAEGALEIKPNRTFALPVLTPQSFREIADLRAMLEGMAAERAATRLNKTDLALLTDINRQMFQTPNKDWGQYLDLNRQFHFHIYAAAGMPRLVRFIESLWLQIGPFLNLVTTKEEMRFGQEAHKAAVRAIGAGDPAGAKAAIERDILDAARKIVEAEPGDTCAIRRCR